MWTPLPFLQGGVEPLTKFSKRRLDRTLIFRGGVGEKEGVTFLRGVVNEKPIYRGGNCLKRGASTVCRFKVGGTWQERRGQCF